MPSFASAFVAEALFDLTSRSDMTDVDTARSDASRTVEDNVALRAEAADEAELARMGYKQELK